MQSKGAQNLKKEAEK